MLNLEEWMDIKSLHHKEGYNIRQIAKLTGRSRNTVRKVLRNGHPDGSARRVRASKLDPFKDYIAGRCREVMLSAPVLLSEIRPMGFRGSVATLRRHLRGLSRERRSREGLTVRFETPPGKQAQVDWGYMGQFPDRQGRPVKIYFFTMVLGFSRMLHVHFTRTMATAELIGCHQLAFGRFGGWPGEILYDNMKQVRLDGGRWPPLLLDFLGHHGITPWSRAGSRCPPWLAKSPSRRGWSRESRRYEWPASAFCAGPVCKCRRGV